MCNVDFTLKITTALKQNWNIKMKNSVRQWQETIEESNTVHSQVPQISDPKRNPQDEVEVKKLWRNLFCCNIESKQGSSCPALLIVNSRYFLVFRNSCKVSKVRGVFPFVKEKDFFQRQKVFFSFSLELKPVLNVMDCNLWYHVFNISFSFFNYTSMLPDL